MGKKKSVVLMTLLTIVIVALCVIVAFPVITLPFSNGIKKWNPAVAQFDLDMDLNGGYYAYYYPEGVIPAAEYETSKSMMQEEEAKEYAEKYVQYGGLYLNTEEDSDIVAEVKEDGTVVLTEEFTTAFESAKKEVEARYAAKGYSEYRVSVIDGCALRIELPASEETETESGYSAAQYASQALTFFAMTGDMSLEQGGAIVDELKEDGVTTKDLIKAIKVKTQYEVVYLEITFTKAGKAMLSNFKSAAEGDTSLTLDVKIGEQVLISISSSNIDDDVVKYSLAEEGDKRYAETLAILLNSAMNNGGYDIEFNVSDMRIFDPVYRGENVVYLVLGAMLVVIVALIALSIVKMGRYGVVSAYSTLSYVVVVALCYAFISRGVFVITPASLLVFLVGLVLINVLHLYNYKAIKQEFQLGKTVESSVKGGYKKTFWATVDIYAVLLLASLALLIGAAGLQTLALQALIVVVTAAFCSLLWARGINFVFLSASKNKYKYFRFVREDDDDE